MYTSCKVSDGELELCSVDVKDNVFMRYPLDVDSCNGGCARWP